jgi:hypothetical protein
MGPNPLPIATGRLCFHASTSFFPMPLPRTAGSMRRSPAHTAFSTPFGVLIRTVFVPMIPTMRPSCSATKIPGSPQG